MSNVFEIVDFTVPVNPTHGWFAIHPHGLTEKEFPGIVLRDFGFVNGLASYVGLCDSDWYLRETEKCQQSVNTLPPKFLFTKAFLEYIPQYILLPDEEIIPSTYGYLDWYITAKLANEKTFRHDLFVNCTFRGQKFVWELQQEPAPGCGNDCHTIGLWKD